ncbi:hypothetical protein NP92_02665 [Anoxybacillus gonensis]|uniref:Lj965 prophage protein n=1 Tax=Anoxybacillus gonensis TaxID=198467 RepID=A0AAW7TDH5_9BACL|nr:hypothetical protein [Anoxybacillus gonensis]AKS37381.1 hypothetical protein AFK25_02240 [Anoxybacillus gonensis]KGP61319.1 hypothetical protein NP92_02665 [Anoxybacillus gonensis]MDO0876818.1 hypothetical protein [Anoxybacillus gonensis]
MLSQQEANRLLDMIKQIISTENLITFPEPGQYLTLDVQSNDETEKFIIDINRKGSIKITKCTYQTRYKKNIPLIRIDIDGQPHTNPDGTEIPCPHIHIYREGFGDKWAFPLEEHIATNPQDLLMVLMDFLRYNRIENISEFDFQGGFV